MSSSTQRTYPTKTKYVPTYRLENLFDDEELALKLSIARHRIIKSFVHATCMCRGKIRGTDNYIIGLGSRQKELANHVIEATVIRMHSGIVTTTELPAFLGKQVSTLRTIAHNAERQLVAVELSLLCPRDIWYNKDGTGTWEIVPSLTDEYRLNGALTREAKRIDEQLRREALHGGGRLRVVH